MNRITVCADPLDATAWTTHVTDEDICAFLSNEFTEMPTDAKLYHGSIDLEHDVTPHDEAGIDYLRNLAGDFWVVTYPHDPITIGIIVSIAIGAISIGLSFLLRPKPPNQSQASPNNTLTGRQNQARLGERIPDIVGTVRSIPDLIVTPYKEYINSQEVEISYMCIGRGAYDIHDIKDNTANYTDNSVTAITGTSVAVYGPNTSPNSGVPQQRVGSPINRKVVSAQPLDLVNGQLLIAPNANIVKGNNNIRFIYPDSINTNNSAVDLTQYFQPNSQIAISNSANTQNGISFNLDGTFVVLSVTSDTVILANPAVTNADWNKIAACNANAQLGSTDFKSPTIATTGVQWIGPFVLNVGTLAEVWANFVAPNGAYFLDGDGNQHGVDVGVQVGITALDASGHIIGSELYYNGVIPGSATIRNTRAVTIKCVLPTGGPVSVRARRTTNMQIDKNDQVSDQTQWADLYAISPVTAAHFGNVTTVQTMTYATQAALSEKERKLNLLVTRRFPTLSGSTFVNPKGTNNAADILCGLALDPFIGNRSISEIDTAGIYGAIAQAQVYFGTKLATEFCYTYDDTNRSFEEIVGDIAAAVGCTAYRRGNIISLAFEKKSSDATLLFNHRNKQPKSETRTVTFGLPENNDGITYDYVNPNASNYPNVDTTQSLYFPRNGSAKNPKKITSIGVRNTTQALLMAWRLYQKMLYQNTIVQFNATREASTCVLNERVLVADNTRQDTIDGEIVGINGLALTLSQPVNIATGSYMIWVQMPDGSLESHTVTPGPNARTVILGSALSQAISSDPRNYALAAFHIVSTADTRNRAFLINDNQPQDSMLQQVKVVNYDDRYYAHDTDVLTGAIIPETGQFDTSGNYLGGLDGSTGGGLPNPAAPYSPPSGTPAPPPTNKGTGFIGL